MKEQENNEMLNNDYIVVTFATKDGKYDRLGKRFENNMKSLNISYDIEYIDCITPSTPNENLLNYKRQKKDTGRTRGEFLKRKLVEHNKTIIWMDCDDGFSYKPSLPSNQFDVGFVDSEDGIRLPIMARLLVLNPTDNALHFLSIWDYLNKWPELEPVGGSHIRLCHARHICSDKKYRKTRNFRAINLTTYLSDPLVIDMHRKN